MKKMVQKDSGDRDWERINDALELPQVLRSKSEIGF